MTYISNSTFVKHKEEMMCTPEHKRREAWNYAQALFDSLTSFQFTDNVSIITLKLWIRDLEAARMLCYGNHNEFERFDECFDKAFEMMLMKGLSPSDFEEIMEGRVLTPKRLRFIASHNAGLLRCEND